MNQGQWLQPRYGSYDAFVKDFTKVETSGIDVSCPGCKGMVRVIRRAPTTKLAGWCKTCNRGVSL